MFLSPCHLSAKQALFNSATYTVQVIHPVYFLLHFLMITLKFLCRISPCPVNHDQNCRSWISHLINILIQLGHFLPDKKFIADKPYIAAWSNKIQIMWFNFRQPFFDLVNPGELDRGWHHNQQWPGIFVIICNADCLKGFAKSHLHNIMTIIHSYGFKSIKPFNPKISSVILLTVCHKNDCLQEGNG